MPRAAAAAELLGRLEDQHQRAVTQQCPALRPCGERPRRAEQHGGMAVVAAAVHLARNDAGPRQAGHLLHRDGVHVGAARSCARFHRRPQHAHHAGDGDAGMHLVAPGAQPLGDERAGGVLLEAQLGFAMDGMAPPFICSVSISWRLLPGWSSGSPQISVHVQIIGTCTEHRKAIFFLDDNFQRSHEP